MFPVWSVPLCTDNENAFPEKLIARMRIEDDDNIYSVEQVGWKIYEQRKRDYY